MKALWSMHNGPSSYCLGHGEPIVLMPGPRRFARPGLPRRRPTAAALLLLTCVRGQWQKT